MAIFKSAPREDPLIVAVSGARLGNRVLYVGGANPTHFVELARRVGLTGQALFLAGTDAEAERLRGAVLREGVVADVKTLADPLDPQPDLFDLAVIEDGHGDGPSRASDAGLLARVRNVLRPGGRVLAMRAAKPSLATWLGRQSAPDVNDIIEAVAANGFSAARLVATKDGIAFVEAGKPGSAERAPGLLR